MNEAPKRSSTRNFKPGKKGVQTPGTWRRSNEVSCRSWSLPSIQDLDISISPKKKIRTVHRLVTDCYRIPGFDYVRYDYLESRLQPEEDLFDLTCMWRAKGVGFDASSGTDTSSSSEDALDVSSLPNGIGHGKTVASRTTPVVKTRNERLVRLLW